VIRAVMKHSGLGLAEAKQLVDRCVFHDEIVVVATPSKVHAAALVAELDSLPAEPRVSAEVVE
jgi:ribosomal protein L7/L12